MIMETIKSMSPPPAIQTIGGKKVLISFLTPDLDVKVVAPVKLSDRKAVTGGNKITYARVDTRI